MASRGERSYGSGHAGNHRLPILLVVAVFGFVLGIITVALFAPPQGFAVGQTTAESGFKTLLALHAALPAFTLGAVALGLLGVVSGVEKVRREITARR